MTSSGEVEETGGASPRRILHCDMDCFYAAVHMRDDPTLEGKPVIIGGSPTGRGVVAAASYEARKFGVRSAMPAARALRLCPHLTIIKPEFDRYRSESQEIFSIFREFTDLVQPVSIDEAYLDVSAQLEEWGSATAVAREIKRRVAVDRGLKVSIGVGPNRLVAKIASDFDKPDGLTVVPPRRVQAFLDPLPTRSLPGIGPAGERRLEEMGVRKVLELRAVPRDELERRFGRWGARLYDFSRGIDDRPLRLHRERKSLSSERTYGEDLAELPAIFDEIDRLSQRVAAGLQRKKICARTFTVKIRYENFETVTRSTTRRESTADAAEISGLARGLLRNSEAGRRPVRLLGVGASKLDAATGRQLRLF